MFRSEIFVKYRTSRSRLALIALTFLVPSTSVIASGQLSASVPRPPLAPTRMSECETYSKQMQAVTRQIDNTITEIVDKVANRCQNATENYYNQYCVSVRIYCAADNDPNFIAYYRQSAPYESEECQVEAEEQTNEDACIRQVNAWQLQRSQQANQGIFAVSTVSYAQNSAQALPDLLTHSSSPVISGIASWGAAALKQKEYLDTAISLLKLSNPSTSSEDRVSIMQSLGLQGAQLMPGVNPISAILMSVATDVIKSTYLKNMATLQWELAAFDSGAPPAVDPNELSMQRLYAEATPPGSEDVASALKQLQAMFSPDANTYVGSEVSWSARTQQSAPTPSFGYAAPPPRSPSPASPPPPPPPASSWLPILQGVAQGYINARQQAALQPSNGPCFDDRTGKTLPSYECSRERAQEAQRCPRGLCPIWNAGGMKCVPAAECAGK